jgi:low temperature requirement protein LtrA
MHVFAHGDLLRARNEGEQPVTPLELFFDLVFVFAVTQLSHRLLEHLTIGSTLGTLLLLVAVWRAWVDTTWVTNWFNPDRTPVRLLLVALMLLSLLMSVAVPEAFGERGLMFALAYVGIQVGRTAFVVLALERSSSLGRNFQRILAWFAIPAVLWVAGGLLEGEGRYTLWVIAVVLEYTGPVAGFWTPGLGRSTTADWTVKGGHFAERCRLFVILALGESILVTGTTFAEIKPSVANVLAFVVAFLGSVALWWLYFARSDEAARRTFSSSEDPGRVARSAYTYFHLPMIAGIIAVAAADELTVAHPGEHGTLASVALTLGGTMLFLAGHALFKWAVFGVLSWPRVVAIAALIALIPVGFKVSALALSGVSGLVVVGLVAVWDTLAYRGHVRLPGRSST